MGIWQTEAILYTRHNTEKIDCQWSTPNQEIEQCKKKNVHISIEQICESEAVKGELGYNTLYLTTALLSIGKKKPVVSYCDTICALFTWFHTNSIPQLGIYIISLWPDENKKRLFPKCI